MSSPKAGHQAHVHHEAGFEDGGAIVRFKLPGLSKTESLTVGFVDRETSQWHELVLVTEGDEMRVTLDGKPLGSHRSEGFAHPVKRWFSMLMNPSAWIDDVKVYKVK